MTDRKGIILRAIVGEYITTASPVASETVVRKHGLGVSSATVRNEMVDLEEEGYIKRPHSSAGRVPLDKGYRFYVESLPDSVSLPVEMKEGIRQRLIQAGKDPELWIRIAASLLARLVHNMSIVTFPKAPQSRLKHLELLRLQEFLALMVVVLQEARLRQQLIPLKNPFSAEDLATVANKLEAQLAGLTWHEIEAKRSERSPFEEQVIDAALLMLREEDRISYSDHYVDGLSQLLSQPEFAQSDKLRELVLGLEEQTLVHAIQGYASGNDEVKVQIGGENSEDILHPLSVVLCRYGISGEVSGVVTVVGPTRMAYADAMAAVKYVSTVMDELIEEVYGRAS